MLDYALNALSDPTRRAILMRLAEGEATAGELARPFAISQPAISHHIKVLERAGLIERRIDAQRRPCRLRAEGVEMIWLWMTQFRVAMEQNYTRLDALLEEMKDADDPDA